MTAVSVSCYHTRFDLLDSEPWSRRMTLKHGRQIQLYFTTSHDHECKPVSHRASDTLLAFNEHKSFQWHAIRKLGFCLNGSILPGTSNVDSYTSTYQYLFKTNLAQKNKIFSLGHNQRAREPSHRFWEAIVDHIKCGMCCRMAGTLDGHGDKRSILLNTHETL